MRVKGWFPNPLCLPMAVKGIFSYFAVVFVYDFKMCPILHHCCFSPTNDKNDQVSEKLLAIRHVRSSFVLLRNLT